MFYKFFGDVFSTRTSYAELFYERLAALRDSVCVARVLFRVFRVRSPCLKTRGLTSVFTAKLLKYSMKTTFFVHLLQNNLVWNEILHYFAAEYFYLLTNIRINMKKLFTLIAATFIAASVSAQTVTESKTSDNWYVGINGGVAWKTTENSWLSNLNGNAGLRIGRYFTPVFGLAVEGNVHFSNKPYESTGTAINYLNTNLLGTINLSNWFGGYKGEPRAFEVSVLYGPGWGHIFGTNGYCSNGITAKGAIDFAFNLGSAKAWQIYLEPAIIHTIAGDDICNDAGVQYNINKSGLQLNVGIVYKFKNSNGTHNFTIAELRDQAEIDALNAKINELRGDLNGKDKALADKDAQLAAKDKQISDLQAALDECNSRPTKPETATNLQPTVLFRQGKSVIDPAQYAPIELIATYMKNHPDAIVEIKGYASPEGSAELNQKLSEDRAAAVKDALVKKYKISADRLTTQGCGATDKLFEQVEFNRVATFNDNTK